MASTPSPRDVNRVTAALGSKNDGSGEVAPLQVDSVTGRLLADITVE